MKKRTKLHSHQVLLDTIRQTINHFYSFTEPTAREVGDAVVREHPELVRDLGADLARDHIYTLVQSRMKASLVINSGNGFKQLKLDIAIDGLPDAISFPSEAEVRFVVLSRAKEKHVIAYEKLLAKQIGNDTRSLRAVQALRGMLTDVWKAHPDVDVAEAVRIYKEDNEPDPPQDGVPAPA